MIQIIASILATTEEEYVKQLQEIENSSAFSQGFIQIDLMDGEFVPNKSVDLEVIKKNPPKLAYEIHLMVADPASWVKKMIGLNPKRVFVHIEAEKKSVDDAIASLQALTDCQTGVALNPQTSLDQVQPYLDTADAVLLMSVEPGFQGQEFIEKTFERVKQLKEIDPEVIIEIDGGIDAKIARELVDAGASNLVIGSHLLKGDIDENLEKIWEAVS